mgnify:CR=1 FL=1
MEKRATIITYGCQMNVNESAKMKQMLQTMGYSMTEDIENTDLVFLNTCTVREGAAVKVYGKLGDLKRIKEEKDGKMIIGVTGCLAQEVRDEFIKKTPYVDLVLGNQNIGRIPDLLERIESGEETHIVMVEDEDELPTRVDADFGDDIVERFKKFIKVVYGDNTFNENMDFIAETLGKKGTETSEDTIRRYFLNDFFNDHVKIYQKRPIYWLFDSGKKNGFKALIYIHRFNENLIPNVRLDYLHRVQTTYEKLLSDVNYKLTTDLSLSDKKAAKNRQADLNAKLNEIKEYDEKIAHIANQRINIDLDDGVKVNYDKFKDILAKMK